MNKPFLIDEITWNDLNMEEVYLRLNHASSSVGQEYLKKTLASPVFDESVLQERDQRAESLSSDPATLKSLQKIFKGLGKTKKVSFLDHIFKIKEIPTRSNVIHTASCCNCLDFYQAGDRHRCACRYDRRQYRPVFPF